MCLVLEGLRKVVGKAFFSWTKWQEESEYFRKKIDCKYLKYYTGSEYLVSHGDLKKNLWLFESIDMGSDNQFLDSAGNLLSKKELCFRRSIVQHHISKWTSKSECGLFYCHY